MCDDKRDTPMVRMMWLGLYWARARACVWNDVMMIPWTWWKYPYSHTYAYIHACLYRIQCSLFICDLSLLSIPWDSDRGTKFFVADVVVMVIGCFRMCHHRQQQHRTELIAKTGSMEDVIAVTLIYKVCELLLLFVALISRRNYTTSTHTHIYLSIARVYVYGQNVKCESMISGLY